MNKSVKLNKIGIYIPENRISNLNPDIVKKFDLDESFIRNKVGFLNRSIKENHEKSSDLCVAAFEDLTSESDFDGEDIKILVVVTQNPDQKIPHTAAIVHNKLNLSPDCMTFDISQGCSGFVHALIVIKSLLKNFDSGKALLFTSDQYSPIINNDHKNESILFGDAATVSLLSFDDIGYEIENSKFGTAPRSNSAISCKEDQLVMDSKQVYNNIKEYVIPSIEKMISQSHANLKKIDLFLTHQGSKYIIDTIRNFFNLESSAMPFLAKNYGNTISSSLPIMLKNIIDNKKHQRILLSSFGVGFSWGNCIIKN